MKLALSFLGVISFARPCFAGAESAGGGDLMSPIVPAIPFEYHCEITWISDIGFTVPGSHAAISRASFVLKNERIAFNKNDLKWNSGFTRWMDPFQSDVMLSPGPGAALDQSVTPYGVSLHFTLSGDHSGPPGGPKSFYSVLELDYGINKGVSSHSNVTAASRALLSDPVITLQGSTYSNGQGELQMHYVFGVVCRNQALSH